MTMLDLVWELAPIILKSIINYNYIKISNEIRLKLHAKNNDPKSLMSMYI